MKLLTQNTKLKKTSKAVNAKVVNFGIPALTDRETGKTTCPFAGECANFCYAQKGAYTWSNVHPAFSARYEATKKDNFADLMQSELNKVKPDYVRVHDSGDYYSPKYIQKWLQIARNNPEIKFYSYTKSMPLWLPLLAELPDNFDIIFSEGSKVDHLIDYDQHRHARIFDSLEDLELNGYVNAMDSDLEATKWFNPSPKVGLIKH